MYTLKTSKAYDEQTLTGGRVVLTILGRPVAIHNSTVGNVVVEAAHAYNTKEAIKNFFQGMDGKPYIHVGQVSFNQELSN